VDDGDEARTEAERRRQSWFGAKRHVKTLLAAPVPHAAARAASRYVPSLRSGRLPAPRDLHEVRGYALGGDFVMLRPDRCENAKALYWGEGYRPAPEDALALDVVVRLARDARTFLDVGAYTGMFTLACAVSNPGLRAHAFEIVPGVADLLEANVERNRLADQVVIHREGIGASGTSMVVPSGEGGSALPSFFSSAMTFPEGVTVGFRSLDSLGELMEATPVVMKVDVEGTEDAVMEHGRAFLAEHRPDVLCEVLAGRARPGVLEDVLFPLGYRAYLVRPDRLLASERIRPHPTFRDWLFTKREPAALAGLGIPLSG
jgi:FkbM family methyltransferase